MKWKILAVVIARGMFIIAVAMYLLSAVVHVDQADLVSMRQHIMVVLLLAIYLVADTDETRGAS